MIDRAKIILAAQGRLGMPYLFGAKWRLIDDEPNTAVDCSGYVRWCFYRGGVTIPDGSQGQYAYSRGLSVSEVPRAGDLGFFLRNGAPYHVGIYEDTANVLEARGEPFNKVIRRPVKKWEAFSAFSGWRRIDG